MFDVNDTVVYGTSGVCVISEIQEMQMMGKRRTYYVLKPIDSSAAKVFVPMENESLTAKMKRVMSRAEAEQLLGDRELSVRWIEDRHEREEKYSEIISGGDKKKILSVLRLLYAEKLRAESLGKKQYAADKRVMAIAEKIIGDEFCYVMKLPKGGVAKYIYEKMAQ